MFVKGYKWAAFVVEEQLFTDFPRINSTINEKQGIEKVFRLKQSVKIQTWRPDETEKQPNGHL